jgi:hypothetical protein
LKKVSGSFPSGEITPIPVTATRLKLALPRQPLLDAVRR